MCQHLSPLTENIKNTNVLKPSEIRIIRLLFNVTQKNGNVILYSNSAVQECSNYSFLQQLLLKSVTYHCNVIVALNNLPDFPHFLLHVARPDLTDYLTGICKCGWHVGRSGRELNSPTIQQRS